MPYKCFSKPLHPRQILRQVNLFLSVDCYVKLIQVGHKLHFKAEVVVLTLGPFMFQLFSALMQYFFI